MISFSGARFSADALMSKQELLDYLEDDPTDKSLAAIRERYVKYIGADVCWRYPISEGMHAGMMLIPVKEGFLSLPYDEVDQDLYEIYMLEDAALLGSESIAYLADEYRSYSDGLLSAMNDARLICLGTEVGERLPLTVEIALPLPDASFQTLYETIWERMGYRPESAAVFDRRHIDVSTDIMEWMFNKWDDGEADGFAYGMEWAAKGPNVDASLPCRTARVHAGFIAFDQQDEE